MKSTGGGIALVLLTVMLVPVTGSTASLLMSWNANTETNLAGYRLYYGTSSRSYGSPVTLGKITSYQLSNVATGKTYYLALTAYNTSGNESSRSSEVSAYVPAAQTQPAVTLVSPLRGSTTGSTPVFTWKGSGIASYKLYASVSGTSYTAIYSGTGTSYALASSFWSLLIPSGSTVYWYVAGTTSAGQVVTGTASYFKKL